MKANIALKMINHAMKIMEDKYIAPLAIVILDERSQVKASICDDGCGTLRYQIALGKASAALGMGFGTRQFHQLVKNNVLPEMFANCINGASNGHFVPLPGGVLILDQQKNIIGAVGISGASSEQDEKVAITLINHVDLVASP